MTQQEITVVKLLCPYSTTLRHIFIEYYVEARIFGENTLSVWKSIKRPVNSWNSVYRNYDDAIAQSVMPKVGSRRRIARDNVLLRLEGGKRSLS